MHEFKIGDTVWVRQAYAQAADVKRGEKGVIIGLRNHSNTYHIRMVDGSTWDLHGAFLSKQNLTDEPAETESSGTKYDAGKPKLSLIPAAALQAEAEVFDFGAEKYGRDNYKAGMDWSRLVDAALRHITAFNSGEDKDPESGLPHLAHARCCLAMLLYYASTDKGKDDRYKEDSKDRTNNGTDNGSNKE